MMNDVGPEPERYYEWMLWKLRQDPSWRKSMCNDPVDDVTKGNFKGWINQSKSLSQVEIFKKEIAEMQKCLTESYIRITELKDEIRELKEKIENAEL